MDDLQESADPGTGFRSRGEVGWLIANLQNDIVIAIHFLGDLGYILALSLNQIRVLQGLRVSEIHLSHTLDIVLVIQGRERPAVRVFGVEETDLDHDAALARFDNKVLETREKLGIPLVEIELVTAI